MENHRLSTTVNHQSPPLNNPITINDPNNSCNPTTFIQTDPSSFKQVVQLLTGKQPTTRPDPVTRTHFKKPSSKLYERRPFSKSFMISPLTSSGGGVFSPEVLSPSVLDFPALALSPVTPLLPDPFCLDHEAEEKAIKEGGFYFHKSPRGEAEPPRLLPLFPMMSPRDEKSSSSS
ncbi:myosin-M heavy chain [Artemisia annua]|uniref:Myosin-M heavy chain n=1 Tax=Artemisia annua TaxID=35608 RepID=A0A2U1P4E8_ARTAN|nr:myosin-M heavy chain [Artemisia annua]